MKKKSVATLTILTILFSFSAIFAVSGDIDTTFNASTRRTNGTTFASLDINKAIKQTDGKILIIGSFTTVGQFARKGIARLNADGAVDTTFNPPEIDFTSSPIANNPTNAKIKTIGLQPDGKILLFGDIAFVNKQSVGKLIRLNSDGSPDTGFNNRFVQEYVGFASSFDEVNAIEVQPDGKILLGGNIVLYFRDDTSRTGGVLRLNSDATFDHSFPDQYVNNLIMNVLKIKVLANGKIMVSGGSPQSFNYTGLARLNSDGYIDFSFSGINVKRGTLRGFVTDFEVLSNGQILIAGNFSDVNGFTVGRISRVNSDGSIDLNFNMNNVGANDDISSIDMDSSGKILIGGAFTSFNNIAKVKATRLNLNGSVDNSFSYTEFNDGFVTDILELPNGQVYLVGKNGLWDRSALLDSDGSISALREKLVAFPAIINTIAIQSDGKILAGGRFERANELKYGNIARFNVDGTIDTNFAPNYDANGFLVNKIIVQPDGKILIASQFDRPLERRNSDGSIDTGFTSEINRSNGNVSDIALLPDGNIIAVGSFTTVTTNNAQKIIRLNANGTKDNTFTQSSPDGIYNKVVVQPDGKLIVVGDFTQVFGTVRGRIARLNADGTLDTSFNPPGGANSKVFDAAVQSDGKIVLVGVFTNLNGNNTNQYVGRLNADGTLDTSFVQNASYEVKSVKIEPSGKILIGGVMKEVGGVPRSGIARLNVDGSIDNTFQVGSGTNSNVNTIALESDDKILLGGEFTKYNNQSSISLVRLQNNSSVPNTATKFDYDGDGRADISVFRPSSNVWYQLLGFNYNFSSSNFGLSGDIVTPGDYDGDGKSDLAVFRPSTGTWWYQSSDTGSQIPVQFGQSGDVPRPADFDGDGKDDRIVYRPSNNVWYRLGSTGTTSIIQFGIAEDKPVVGDFDGDGKGDIAIYRPSTGTWWYQSSFDGQNKATQFGILTDIPNPADYDGDGKTDLAVFRPSTGVWYIFNSSNNSATIIQFGTSGDKPIAADYDGDGKADIAVYRPSNRTWYLLRSTEGFTALQFGISTDIPIPNAFVP